MKKFLYFSSKKALYLFVCWLVGVAANAQIASWTYEPLQGTLDNPTANVGTGTSALINLGGGTITTGTATGMAGTGCGPQSGVTAWALNPFDAGSTNESNGVQFNASTVGYQNITFTWDQRWSNTAANTVRLQYTTNGSTWNSFNMTAGNTTFCNGSINGNGCFEANSTGDEYRRTIVNFSAIPTANNNPNFGIRLLAAHYQSTGQFRQVSTPAAVANPLGTWRFDNVSFNGTLLPGPTASVISGTTAICNGLSTNLVVTITGGTGPFTVVYTNGVSNFTVNNYTSGANISITPTVTRTYTIVSVTNANGVAGTGNSGAAVVTVKNNTATVTATNLSTCATGAFTMSGGSPVGGTYSIGSPYSGGTTTFTYSYTDASGCPKSSATFTFTRNVAPVISPQPSGSETVCQNTPFSLVTVTATGTSLVYQWYRNTTNSTTGGTALTGAAFAAEVANGSKTATFTPLSNTVGTYYYYVTVANTCSTVKSGTAGITAVGPYVVTPAAVGGTASPNQSICNGAPTDLNLSGFTNSVTKWQYASDFAFSTPVDIPSSNSATLTSAQMGTLTSTRYYRAVVANGSCNAYSNVVTVSYNATTWNGSAWSNGVPSSSTAVVFNGDYSSASDVDACSVKVNSGNITINSGHTLRIENQLDILGGSVTFENNASLVQINNGTNTGNITYKRDTTPMRKYDYTYWSSPVDYQILANLSPFTLSDKYFWFNTTFYNWEAVTAPALTPMDIGKGYIIRAPQNFDPVTTAVFNGTFVGQPNNGDYSVSIVKSGSNDLNCIGNPYPSAISAKKFIEGNTAAFGLVNPGTTLYFWTHNTAITNNLYTFDDYATYNFTGGAGTGASAAGLNNAVPNGMIAAGQAFMIKGVIEGTTTATFTNAMREVGNNSQFFRTQNDLQRNRIWLELKNSQGAYKQILVGYIENATDGLDNAFDGETLEAGNSASFYSILDNKKLAIQGRSLEFSEQDQIPLGFKTSIAGDFEIDLSDFDGFFETQDVYLEDRLLGVVHNLKESAYSFVTESGVFDSRFVLRFSNSLLGNSEAIKLENEVIIYKNLAKQVVLNSGVKKMKNIKIFDTLGRLLLDEKNINSNYFVWSKNVNELFLFFIELNDNQIISKKYSN
ncbi:lipoprotein LpqH [Flavobacterium sp. CYK-4]|uniref:lipoprotein LpqH n=1 Tax=Flavobacterium lotistagni TaxID=2709660 RepID=UPI0014093B64|nr:lipoprotein LpqH [Flavobacterium lotistagni]NHM07350.1 lipoprotein LpqH [Flavobacterium lotistagni]